MSQAGSLLRPALQRHIGKSRPTDRTPSTRKPGIPLFSARRIVSTPRRPSLLSPRRSDLPSSRISCLPIDGHRTLTRFLTFITREPIFREIFPGVSRAAKPDRHSSLSYSEVTLNAAVKDEIEFLKNVPILCDLEPMDLDTISKVGVRKKYKKAV